MIFGKNTTAKYEFQGCVLQQFNSPNFILLLTHGIQLKKAQKELANFSGFLMNQFLISPFKYFWYSSSNS